MLFCTVLPVTLEKRHAPCCRCIRHKAPVARWGQGLCGNPSSMKATVSLQELTERGMITWKARPLSLGKKRGHEQQSEPQDSSQDALVACVNFSKKLYECIIKFNTMCYFYCICRVYIKYKNKIILL